MIVIARALLGGIVAAIIIVGGALFVSTATGPIGLILGALVVLPLWQVVTTLVRWQNEEYIVTNRRVIKVEGVVSKHVFDSSLEKINDVELDQSWLGRLLNYGDVEIITGSDIGENKFTHLANPIGFKLALLNQKEALGTVTDFGAREKRVLTSDAPTKGDIPELIAE
ncbi:MAG: PH domain-containing protein, partial [Chloroflexota bacterium]